MNKTKLLVSCIEKSLKVCAVSVLSHCVLLPLSYAAPTGGNIVGGVGNINQSSLNTTINQLSNRLAIDWQTFNINSNESVNFNQPGRSSIALNRILDQNASQIHGSINANGQIVLVNPNGVFFGKNSTVNAGGLFAAALDVNPEDFMQGRLDFKALENSSGLIINEGRLEVIDGGALVLLGQKVENRGMLVANFGTVTLAAGHDISVRFSDYENFSINISQNDLAHILGLENPSVLNTGLIQAHNGNVVLTAKQADAIKSSINNIDHQQAFSFASGQIIEKDGAVYLAGPDGDISDLGVIDVSNESDAGVVIYSAENINHSGSINADTETGIAGTVKFDANDTTLLSGNSTISAQATVEGVGGTVHVLGKRVGLTDNANINASGVNGGGEVLIGGDYQGKNSEVKNAQEIYLGENTSISANAIEEGNGGKIIGWSDKTTRVYGDLSATGGEQSGNGGFIETSSHDYIDLAPKIDVHAFNGLHGEWLIDPSSIEIHDVGINNVSGFPLGPFIGNVNNISSMRTSSLGTALENGANITIQTNVQTVDRPIGCTTDCIDTDIAPESTAVPGRSFYYGDIVLNSDLDFDNAGTTRNNGVDNASSLTLLAHRDIVINGRIFDSDGDNTPDMTFIPDGDILNLTLTADWAGNGGANQAGTPGLGSVRINNDVILQGGNFYATGVNFIQDENTIIDTRIPALTGSSGFNPVVEFGGGPTPDSSVTIIADNGVSLGGISTQSGAGKGALSITANNGNIASTVAGTGALVIAGTTTLDATGSIDLNTVGNDFVGAVAINSGTAVTLADNNSLTTNINSNSVTSIATNTSNLGNSIITDIDAAGTTLAAMNVSGDLTVNSAGSLFDSGNVVVGGNTLLNLPDGSSVFLDSLGNDFTGTLTAMANSGNLLNYRVYNSSALNLQNNLNVSGFIDVRGASLTTNNFTLGGASVLNLSSTAGDINQNNVISHTGETVLSAVGGNINLNLANNLNSVQVNNAGTATINNDVNNIDIVSVANTTLLDIDAQNITQSGDINATTVDLTALNSAVLNAIDATTLNVDAAGGISETGVITVSGTTTLDSGVNAVALNTNTHSLNDVLINNASSVSINEFDNINIAGNMGALNVFAGIGAADSAIANVQDAVLDVTGNSSFTFINDGSVNLDNFTEIDLSLRPRNNLQGDIEISTFFGTLTDVSIRNAANIQLSSSDITNDLTLDTTAAISQNSILRVTGNTSLQAASINLNNAFNNFDITQISNTATATISDINDITLTSVTNGDVSITANGLVSVEGAMNNLTVNTTSGDINSGVTGLTVSNNTNLTTAAIDNIDFQTNQVDLQNLNVGMANNVLINEADGLQVNSATVNGLMDIDATDTVSVNGNIANLDINTTNTISLSGSVGIVNAVTTAGGIQNGAAALTVIDTATLDAGVASNVTLDNAANDFARVGIVSAQDVSLRDVNGLQLMAVNSNNLTVNAGDDITQAPATVLTVDADTNLSSGNGDVILTEANMLTNLSITGGNNASVVNAQALLMNDSSLLGNIDISTTAGNLSINNIGGNGSVSLSAADALIDANGDDLNISAASISLTAANGIGTTGGSGDINIQTANLSALNTNSGDINIKNTGGDITLVNITNNATDTGNFNFESTDDVLIDNITLQQNLTEEFYPNGTGTVNMRSVNGSFLGVGDEDVNSPDITATNLRLVGVKGNFGTLQRPMVLDISGKVELLMRASLDPIYISPAPNPETDIRDDSLLQFTSADTLAAANGVQITEVETLLDIDPAIFTDIRHFVVGSEPVLLPRDQLFDVENEDEDEDDEFFKRISGEEGPLEN